MVERNSLKAEGARFALLRRLSPSLRHRLMGDLQPVTLLTELAERQMSKAAPDLEKTKDTIVKARHQARTAVASMLNMLAWITYEENPDVLLKEGIDGCVDLLRTDSEVRGVRITRGEFQAAQTVVNRRALRTVTAAALIAAVDMRPAVSEIQLSCARERDGVIVRIEARYAGEGTREDFAGDTRPLTWEDVDVIAADEGVIVERRLDPFVLNIRIPATA